MARFETVSDETIKQGNCTDIYFVRTEETLRQGCDQSGGLYGSDRICTSGYLGSVLRAF